MKENKKNANKNQTCSVESFRTVEGKYNILVCDRDKEKKENR